MVNNRFNSNTESPTTPDKAVDKVAFSICRRFERLKADRANWESIWQEVLKFVIPRKAFVTRKRETAGERVDNDLFDTTARRANQILASGFQGNMTNPSTKWFNLRVQDPLLNNNKEVKLWLADSENKLLDVLNASNFNQEIHEAYLDLGSVGTAAILEEEDATEIIRFKAIFVEELYIDENYEGRVDTVYRSFRLTARQAWEKWGDKAGKKVKEAMEKNKWEEKIKFIHCVQPRESFNRFSSLAINMPYESVIVESDSKIVVAEGGFEEFPYMVTRFMKVAGDMYGYCPGIIMLPDIKMLNSISKTLIKAAEKIVDPPLIMPHDGFLLPLRTVPGGLNYKLSGQASDRIEALETKGNIPVGRDMQNDVRQAINAGFFTDLFLLLADRKNMTATEVQERVAEKMIMLGPVIGRLQSEMLDPIITRTFGILLRKGILLNPPPVIEGREVVIEYVSPLALAQRREAITSVNSLLSLTGAMAQAVPDVIDKIDTDKVVDEAAEIFGVSPEIIRDSKQVAAIREERAQAQQAAEAVQGAAQVAQIENVASQTQKNLAEAESEEQ